MLTKFIDIDLRGLVRKMDDFVNPKVQLGKFIISNYRDLSREPKTLYELCCRHILYVEYGMTKDDYSDVYIFFKEHNLVLRINRFYKLLDAYVRSYLPITVDEVSFVKVISDDYPKEYIVRFSYKEEDVL